MFGKVKKRQTPKQVSFFLRDEIVKFERYKKQMLFIYDNDIETAEQLERYRQIQQEEIAKLTDEHRALYTERTTPEAAENAAARIAEINIELRALRANVRMCNMIMVDAERIADRQRQLLELQKQEEVKRDDTKRRSR